MVLNGMIKLYIAKYKDEQISSITKSSTSSANSAILFPIGIHIHLRIVITVVSIGLSLSLPLGTVPRLPHSRIIDICIGMEETMTQLRLIVEGVYYWGLGYTSFSV